ncbi:MAG TPA: carboxypeptidase-like regulatory domain-containing protein, partial [Thermoanaerobaculia bacterium]
MKHAGIHRGGIAGLLLLLILGAVCGARAQTSTSSIRGVILDQSGPVAEATVTAVGTQSGFRYTATTGPDGSFSLAGLNPGVYTLTVSSSAYAPQSRTVQVLVGQDVDADFVLSPDQVFTEEVSVVGEAVQLLVETRTSEIATNVTTQQIESLPQNDRNFLGLAALAPGVRFTDNQDDTGKFRSGAADARQVNVFIDGLSYKNDLLQGGAFMQDASRGNPFPQNAVQEFRVLTQNYKAEYEKAAAAVITAVTKSGGNKFNGDLLYLFQDKDFVTQDDFSKERGDKKPDYERNQYGLSLGGPIQRDRLHFFLSYERNEQDRLATIFRGASFPS